VKAAVGRVKVNLLPPQALGLGDYTLKRATSTCTTLRLMSSARRHPADCRNSAGKQSLISIIDQCRLDCCCRLSYSTVYCYGMIPTLFWDSHIIIRLAACFRVNHILSSHMSFTCSREIDRATISRWKIFPRQFLI